jgi:hypothetical protein
MDAKEIEKVQDRMSDEVKRVSAEMHRAAMRAPEVADRVSEAAHRVAMRAPEVAGQVSDEVGTFVRRNHWVPILSAATLGFVTAVIVMARPRPCA